MSWLFFTFLACSSGEKTREKPKEDLKKAELEIQSSRSAPIEEKMKPDTNLDFHLDFHPKIWAKNPEDQMLSSLAAQLDAPILPWDGKELKARRGELVILYLTEPQELPPKKGAVVFVVDGNWSAEDIASLSWKGGGIVNATETMALFASEKHLNDPQLKAGVLAWQIAEHYQIPRQRLDRDIPTALYGILGTEKAEADHKNPHMRYFAASSPEDSSMVVRLATARETEDQVALEKLALDSDPWVRARAMDRLENVEILGKGLSDPSSLVRVVAGHQLSLLAKEGNNDACSPLKDAVKAPDAYVRWKGAYGLGYCDALDDLVALLEDVDIDVQRQAAQSLGRQKELPKAEKSLKKKLKSKNSFVRRWVLDSLTHIQTKEMNEFLLDYAKQSSSILERITLQRILSMRGFQLDIEEYTPPSPPKNRKELEEILKSKDPTTRKDVAKFLIFKKSFHEQLYLLTQEEDSEIRKSAVEGLGWNGDPRIYQFLDDPDPDVVVTALNGIRRSRIGNGKGLEPLLKDSDSEIRYRAVQALVAVFGELSQKQRNLLGQFCSDPDERIRAAALMIYPKKMKSDESSDWVRWKISLSESMVYRKGLDDMASLSIKGNLDKKVWIRGVVAIEDEFLHRRFSWNDEKDRPPSHRALRPPLFREYGFPNRG